MIRSVLIARGAFGDIYEPAWVRALRELGVDAHLFDAHSLTGPGLLGRVERRLLWGPGIVRIQRALETRLRQLRPQVLLLYQGHYYPAEVVQRLRALTFVTGCHNDDPFGTRGGLLRYRHLLPALPHYQGYHVYRPVNVAEALAYGIPRVDVMPPYFIPWLDYPRQLTQEQQSRFDADLIFAGHAEPDDRMACITAAVRRGYRFRVYGGEREWRKTLPKEIFRQVGKTIHLDLEHYRQALCSARIGVCFLSKWNRDIYTRRVFEIPACGVFLLSERTPWLTEMFREGHDAEFFSSPEEFVDKAGYYLQHTQKREQIALAGYQRVWATGQDIHARLRCWLEQVTSWYQEP
ncbi:MAG: glycosyltransferase [Magnetococcus sp. YQC-5]